MDRCHSCGALEVDLETLNDTRVWPAPRTSRSRDRERRSNRPANHPKPKLHSRFSANEKTALFSSVHQIAS